MHSPDCRTVTTKLLSGDPEYDCDCGEVSAYEACKSLNRLWLETVEEEVPETYRHTLVKQMEREWDGQ